MFSEIEKNLIHFEKPARYIGNETGIPQKDFEKMSVRMAISYPDVYEIGMSNMGIKIIYDIVNRIPFAGCERVFSPWPDFQKYLKDTNYSLYSLESKTPLSQFDILGISIQYELLFSNFLGIIDLGGIPLRRDARGDSDPIVIIGGPAVSNPKPYYPFVDLVVFGEAEDCISQIISYLHDAKTKGLTRKEKIAGLSNIDGVLSPEFTKTPVKRIIYKDFIHDSGLQTAIIPSIDIIQNKLVVEIMRGCPNKCRFCQAGILYKPVREKNTSIIMKAIEKGLSLTGVNEVTFASLSSGDYTHIISLTDHFNKEYSNKGISVSLPSLKVESFDEDILDRISLIRKSGLTFAIESGSFSGQMFINKLVEPQKVNSIIKYALTKGWKTVKLYFMIGLPDAGDQQTHDIINFVNGILHDFKSLSINLNVAVFVPKPHTPYELCKQLTLEESKNQIFYLKDYYKRTRVNVKFHPPEMSYIEGFITRGDECVGYAMEEAYLNGASFDGWNDKFSFQLYNDIFKKHSITYENYLSGGSHEKFWSVFDPLISDEYLQRECENSRNGILISSCKSECEAECTICSQSIKMEEALDDYIPERFEITPNIKGRFRYILEFTKLGLSKYLSHKDMMRYFETLFRMRNIQLMLSEGFNPHPRFQFSSALSLGLPSECELLEFYTTYDYSSEELILILNSVINKDIRITRIRKCESTKKKSLYENLYRTIYRLIPQETQIDTLRGQIDLYLMKSTFIYSDLEKEYDLRPYISFIIEDESILMTQIRTNPFPKLINFVNAILNNQEITIIKTKMTCISDTIEKDLFFLE